MSYKSIFLLSAIIIFGFFLVPVVQAVGITPIPGQVLVNSNRSNTQVRKVSLQITAPTQTAYMMISNLGNFAGAGWEKYKAKKTWYLDYGSGPKTVFVRFKFKDGTITRSVYDTITLNPANPLVRLSLPDGDKTSSRYVTVSTTFSNGIEDYRFGDNKDLAGEEWQTINNRITIIVSAGEGQKTVYLEFRDSSGQIVKQILSVLYNETGRSIFEGSVVVGQDKSVYYYGFDGKLHLFPNEEIFRSWFPVTVKTVSVSNAKINQYIMGTPMCVRSGTNLVKFSGSPRVYAVEPGCLLRQLRSPVEAFLLYGAGWESRIVGFSSSYKTQYIFNEPVVITTTTKQIIDKDNDGISYDQEIEYGTSDRQTDSDGDSLSDYEEIFFWFSDPTDIDTDGDGYADAREILNGYSPIGSEKLTSVPKDTYTHYRGTVVQTNSSAKKYYIISNSKVYSLGEKTTAKIFVDNNLQAQFIARPPLSISLPTSNASTKNISETISLPFVYRNGVLKKL
jgi:hypothetical protein